MERSSRLQASMIAPSWELGFTRTFSEARPGITRDGVDVYELVDVHVVNGGGHRGVQISHSISTPRTCVSMQMKCIYSTYQKDKDAEGE